MPANLLLDFGATRLKAALCGKDGELFAVKSYPSTPARREGSLVEIPLQQLLQDFQEVLQHYDAIAPYERVFVCSQMHGFVLTDEQNRPLTDYISWQDERALQPLNEWEKSSWEIFSAAFAGNYKDITGMRLRAGFPVVKILDFLRKNSYPCVRVLSLPEALCLGGKPFNKVHITMAAGSGCIDFLSQLPSPQILDFIQSYTKSRVEFNQITKEIEPAAQLTVNGRRVMLYTGIGDHQCAVYGAGNTLDTLSVNIGTGSQVTAVCTQASATADTERRHFLHGLQMQTITHIPAGRVLAALIAFYESISGRTDGWDCFASAGKKEDPVSCPHFNLALFADAWSADLTPRGSITGLTLENLTSQRCWAGLFYSFAEQYIQSLSLLDTSNRSCIILSGGKLAKNIVLADYFQKKFQKKVQITHAADETLVGLSMLAGNYCL